MQDSNMFMYRAVCKVRCSMKAAFEYMTEQGFLKSNPITTELKLIEQLDPSESHWYTVTKFPFPFKSRDWLTSCRVTQNSKETVFLSYSVVRPDVPIKKKYIRGDILGLSRTLAA